MEVTFIAVKFVTFGLILMGDLDLMAVLNVIYSRVYRRSSQGVVSWTYDLVLALGQRFNFHSLHSFCYNPLEQGIDCTLPSILGCVLKE